MRIALTSERPLDEVRRELFAGVLSAFETAGYRRTTVATDRYELSRSYRSASVWGLSLATMPLGLVTLALLRRIAVVHVHLAPSPSGGTYIAIDGEADAELAAQVHRLVL